MPRRHILEPETPGTIGKVLAWAAGYAYYWADTLSQVGADLTLRRDASTTPGTPARLRLEIGQGGKYVGRKAPQSLVASYDLTEPTTLGTGGFLKTDASGQQSVVDGNLMPVTPPYTVPTGNYNGDGGATPRRPDLQMSSVNAGDAYAAYNSVPPNILYTYTLTANTLYNDLDRIELEIVGEAPPGASRFDLLGPGSGGPFSFTYGTVNMSTSIRATFTLRVRIIRVSVNTIKIVSESRTPYFTFIASYASYTNPTYVRWDQNSVFRLSFVYTNGSAPPADQFFKGSFAEAHRRSAGDPSYLVLSQAPRSPGGGGETTM